MKQQGEQSSAVSESAWELLWGRKGEGWQRVVGLELLWLRGSMHEKSGVQSRF